MFQRLLGVFIGFTILGVLFLSMIFFIPDVFRYLRIKSL